MIYLQRTAWALLALVSLDAATESGTELFARSPKPVASAATSFLGDNVVVHRGDPFLSYEDLQNDAGVAAITNDVADFCTARPGSIHVDELIRYLSDRHPGVSSPRLDPQEYKFAIDPDGNIYEICCLMPMILIDDGEQSPIVVSISLVTVL